MDITLLFKACVKTVRTKNKALGIGLDRSGIFPRRCDKSEFMTKIRELIDQITRVRHLLLKHRNAYLNCLVQVSDSPHMTDDVRAELELGAERFIGSSSHLLDKLSCEWESSSGPSQLIEHHRIALELTKTYLKDVCELYAEQKLMRVCKTMEIKKLSRLELETSSTSTNTSTFNGSVESEAPDVSLVSDLCDHSTARDDSFMVQDVDMSLDELQVFQQENLQLYNELNFITGDVQQIQNKVIHIAKLQDVFTKKVMEQEEEIVHISSATFEATLHLEEAYKEVRKLDKKNLTDNNWTALLFIFMCFSLLFLHWYSD